MMPVVPFMKRLDKARCDFGENFLSTCPIFFVI
jgi:hypothetical protein